MNAFELANESYRDRKYLYLFPQLECDYWAVNYYAVCTELNSLLKLFSINGKSGKHKLSEDNNHSEVWFEVSDDFYYLATESSTFRAAIERLGVTIVTDYPFFTKRDTWSTNWKDEPEISAHYNARWSFFKGE
jgi:hypothetical protein